MAAGAAGLVTEEEQGAALLFGGQRRIVVLEITIERRVGPGEGLGLEGGDRRGGVLEAELARGRAGEGGGELGHVLRNGEQALHDRLPHRDEITVAQLRELVRVPEPIAVAWRTAHLLPVHDREHRLRGEDVGQSGGEGDARRRLECEARSRHAAVPEQIEGAEPRVDQCGRVARDELASRAERPRRPQPAAARADRQRQSVPRVRRRVVAGGARDVTVPAQDLVEHERLTEVDQRRRLGGRRPDRHRAPPAQALPQVGVERRRWSGGRFPSVATGRQHQQAEVCRPYEACHHRAPPVAGLSAAGARPRIGA